MPDGDRGIEKSPHHKGTSPKAAVPEVVDSVQHQNSKLDQVYLPK